MARGPGQSARESQRRNASGAIGLLSEYAGEVLRGDMLRRGLDRYYRGIGAALSGDHAAFSGLLGDAFPGGGGLLGTITDIRPPAWNRAYGPVPVGVNPTQAELRELFKAQQELRALIPKNADSPAYFWPADAALHQDIGARFGLSPSAYEHGLLTPDLL